MLIRRKLNPTHTDVRTKKTVKMSLREAAHCQCILAITARIKTKKSIYYSGFMALETLAHDLLLWVTIEFQILCKSSSTAGR